MQVYPMPASTANWHWKNKNITTWSKEWFERELVAVKISGDGQEVVSVSKVEVDGDVELGQRKSRLLTIYECKIALEWTGTAEDGTEVSGTLTVPEVSHEITLDGMSDYVYEWSLKTASSPAVDKLFQFAKKRLPTDLEVKFAEFPAVIIEMHGKDLQVSATPSAEPSRTGTPAPLPVASSSAPKPTAIKREEKRLNTVNVSVDATFMASAEDMFAMLTDESKIPMWTRAPAQSVPEPGKGFSLFGGGVKGTYVSVERPHKIVQSWALSNPSWPAGNPGTMTITFDQSSDSTKMTLSLDGVPTGLQDEIKRNIEGYYIHGLKSIGLGSEL